MENTDLYQNKNTTELVHELLSHFHADLKKELADIEPLFEKVSRVHGSNHPELIMGLEEFRKIRKNLEFHLMKEESVLFPLILDYESQQAQIPISAFSGPLSVLRGEHDHDRDILFKIRDLTQLFRVPQNACKSYERLMQSLQQFHDHLLEHMRIENEILFARFESGEKSSGGCCGMCQS